MISYLSIDENFMSVPVCGLNFLTFLQGMIVYLNSHLVKAVHTSCLTCYLCNKKINLKTQVNS